LVRSSSPLRVAPRVEPALDRRGGAIDVSRKTLSAILNGRAGISPEMAIRLSLAFGTTPESWLNQQLQYDLWRAGRTLKKLHVRKLVAA
jgi:addiction module HigA family antidote